MEAAATLIAEPQEPAETCCYHCRLPVPEEAGRLSLEVHGEPRRFCCHGCHAVCKAILDAGLDDYYRHRTNPAVSAGREPIPDFLKQAELVRIVVIVVTPPSSSCACVSRLSVRPGAV